MPFRQRPACGDNSSSPPRGFPSDPGDFTLRPFCDEPRARQLGLRSSPRHPWATRPTTPNTGQARPGRGRGQDRALSFRPRVPAFGSSNAPPLVPTAPGLPGRVAPQHLLQTETLRGLVGQLRLRRLLLPPPAALHPPVAPPGPVSARADLKGVGVAGHGARGRRWRRQRQGSADGSAAPLRQSHLAKHRALLAR